MIGTLEDMRVKAPVNGRMPVVAVQFRRRTLVLLSLAFVAPWLVVAYLVVGGVMNHRAASAEAPAAFDLSAAPKVSQSKPGPWGHLHYVPLAIDLPDEFVFVPPANQPPVRWFFPGYSQDKVVSFLKSAGAPAAHVDAVAAKAKWGSDAEGAWVEPGDDFILELSAEARAKIYTLLVEFAQNSRQIDPIWFYPAQVDYKLQDSGMSAATLTLVKKLLYKHDDLLLFADFEPALRQLPDDAERRRLVKALARKDTLFLRLKMDAESDAQDLANYWGLDGRKKDLLPLFASARRVDNGCELSAVCILPNFARDHLYLHPFPSVGEAKVKQDCFWSALNFFNETPNDRLNDMSYVNDLLKRDYYTVLEPSQLGDLVFLTTRDSTVIHAAAYVADDVVFTKNGEAYTQPWILMHMQDMLNTYAVKHPASGPLKPLYFRKKML